MCPDPSCTRQSEVTFVAGQSGITSARSSPSGPVRTHQSAYAIGGLFLAGGIAACFMIPAPAWFMAADLLLACLPMAWLAIKVGQRMASGNAG